MGIFEMIKDFASGTSKKGIFSSIAKSAIPMILMALFRNASDGKGAKSLVDALSQHENGDGSLLDSAGDILDKLKNVNLDDGNKILRHAFGSNVDNIVSQISNKTGVSAQEGLDILSSVAPKVLEMIASDTKGNRSIDSIQDMIKRELMKVDDTDGLPNLPNNFKNILGGGSDSDNILGKLFGDDEDDSNVLFDILGGFLN